MNERQRDRFLYQWSRRRAIGRHGAARRGMLAGAVGGVVVAGLIEASAVGSNGIPVLSADDAAKRILSALPLTLVAVPLLASIGRALSVRRWVQRERRYRLLLIDAGVTVPRSKPALRLADRAPVFAAWTAVAFVAGMVAFVRWWVR